MTDRPAPRRHAGPDAAAAAHAEQPAGPPGLATPADRSVEADADWPDPVELTIGLDVRYLEDEARSTYFGDLGVAGESVR